MGCVFSRSTETCHEEVVQPFLVVKSEITFIVWARKVLLLIKYKNGINWRRYEKGHSATFKVIKNTNERELCSCLQRLLL